MYAAAELRIKHDVARGLQLRDVDSHALSLDQFEKIPMIHMGRAWLPTDYAPGLAWFNPEGRDFVEFGNQVWCKCNYTALDILPWPIPMGTDHVSRITLTYLHDSRETYGYDAMKFDNVNRWEAIDQEGYSRTKD